jgi:hypothetical protein
MRVLYLLASPDKSVQPPSKHDTMRHLATPKDLLLTKRTAHEVVLDTHDQECLIPFIFVTFDIIHEAACNITDLAQYLRDTPLASCAQKDCRRHEHSHLLCKTSAAKGIELTKNKK